MTDHVSQQDQLEAEFPTAMLGQVPKGGQKLTYVPAAEVMKRLNEVLGVTGWSWETDRVWRDETDSDWVLATGKLTATIDGVTASKAGEGGVKVKRLSTGTKEIVDLGDEFKGAASDAMKKAAQKFGVALYLARKDDAKRYEAPAPVRDAIAEGYDSHDAASKLIDAFVAAMKAAPPEVVKGVKDERDRLGVIWPPTKDEYDALMKYLDDTAPDVAGIVRNGPSKPQEATSTAGGAGGGGTPSNAPPVVLGGWATEEERDAETHRVMNKAEELGNDLYEKLETWARENKITLPATKTDTLRYEAFIDAITQPVPAST